MRIFFEPSAKPWNRETGHQPVRRPAMTLVETMMSMLVFTIVILGTFALILFSMRNMDAARNKAQVDAILTNEIEAMRMRGWNDRVTVDATTGKPITLYGLKTLGSGFIDNGTAGTALATVNGCTEKALSSKNTLLTPGKYSSCSTEYEITPFAVYGVLNSKGTGSGNVGAEVVGDANVKLRNAEGLTLRRIVRLSRSSDSGATAPVDDVDTATITVIATWSDRRGAHTRSLTQILSQNGLSDFYYRSVPY